MDKFKEIIDTFLSNYSTYNDGKVAFECETGELIFFKKNTNVLTIYGIYIFPEYRQNGICREILHYLIDSSSCRKFKKLCVQSVLSNILYDYLCRFEYKNKSFSLQKAGFFYDL